MPGNAIGSPSGVAGRTGQGQRMLVAGVSRFEPRPAREVRIAGATFSSARDQVRQRWLISGITRDSAGAALGNCVVKVFRTGDDMLCCTAESDASGNYAISVDGNSYTRFIVSYKAGTPDISGTTANTLVPVLV